MFDGNPNRIFALPPGCDFSLGFLQGLTRRLHDQPPEALARVEVFVNTERTRRRLVELFQSGPPSLLPRLRVITDLAREVSVSADIPPAISPLRRRLELSQIIAALLDKEPDLAPRTAIYDLADSLAGLMDEMHGEGVAVDRVLGLDMSPDFSAHWGRSLTFLKILRPYFADMSEPDAEARQRLVVAHLAQLWKVKPPTHPVIVAGSTGSRGSTSLFMQAVCGLPNGAVVLPGFDFDLPLSVWASFDDPLISADHPQAGFYKLLDRLSGRPDTVQPWADISPANPARNRLVSLALRPAPVTDQWLIEGPNLTNLDSAARHVSLIEAPSQREEALAIALCLRDAAEKGQKATLISPDRTLTRQVTAALERWNILPDDSAGQPLPLTPPGIFLRLVSDLFGQRLTTENLLILLKHPLTHTGGGRGKHLLWTRDLELEVLRGGAPFVDFDAYRLWSGKKPYKEEIDKWFNWLEAILNPLSEIKTRSLSEIVAHHRTVSEALAMGSNPSRHESELWLKEAGIKAAEVFAELEDNADAGGIVTPSEYAALFPAILNRAEVRETITAHPLITIWGTLEARVQGADLVILGGLNDGVWPGLPTPDPWLNRSMRRDAGLLLPERQIGLSAHDFQQAIAAPNVILTRAARLGDAPAVASRWVIRLTNLMNGIGAQGQGALTGMRERGQVWLDMAARLEQPKAVVTAAKRPAPRPPDHAHPRRLSVTRIRTLVRDPYAIYAQYVLGLRKLDPIRREPDAMLRGQAIHQVLEEFIQANMQALSPTAARDLIDLAARIFDAEVPWPATRRIWLARLARVADVFVRDEYNRREQAMPFDFELKGKREMLVPDFTLTATLDRIDRTANGSLVIFDYKTGAIPTQKQIREFDKQLPLEAAIAEAGGLTDIAPTPVSGLVYIGLGSDPKTMSLDLGGDLIDTTWAGLVNLIQTYRQGKIGYTARARMEMLNDASDYDHLSRFGEWEDSEIATPEDVG